MTDWKPPPHTYRQAPEPEKHGQIPIPGIKGHEHPPKGEYVKPGSKFFKQTSNPHVWGTIAGEHNPFHSHELGDDVEYGGHSSEPDSVHEWNLHDHEGFDESKKHLQRLTDKSHPAIRVSDDVLHKVLDEGRFKSQFETQTSRGNLNNGMRSNVEARKFGYPDHIKDTSYNDPNDYEDHYEYEDHEDHEDHESPEPRHPDEGRPIYGYLSHEGLKTRIDDNTSHYGEHKVVLHKPSVWHRTTMTMGDSLNNHSRVAPSPVSQVSPYSFHPGSNDTDRDDSNPYATEEGDTPAKRIKAIKHFGPSKARTEHGKHPEGMGHDYVEAQIHGGVKTSDIHYVHLASEYHRGSNRGIKEKLNHHGIPWVEASNDGTGQVADQSPSRTNPKESLFNRTTLAVESYLQLMRRHAMGQVRVVAQQGSDRFLLSETSGTKSMVRVADTKTKTISGEVPLQSMLKQGYWEDPEPGVNAHAILALVKPSA